MIKKPVTIRNSMDMETRPIAHPVSYTHLINMSLKIWQTVCS